MSLEYMVSADTNLSWAPVAEPAMGPYPHSEAVVLNSLHWFLRVAVTRNHRLSSLKNKFIVSRFWRLDVDSFRGCKKKLCCLSLNFWRFPSSLWHYLALRRVSSLCLHVHVAFYLCASPCVHKFLF